MEHPLIKLEDTSIRLRDRLYLEHTTWQMNPDEHWAVLGPNGAGKSTFVKSLFGDVPIVRGKVTLRVAGGTTYSPSAAASKIGYVSSDLHRAIFQRQALEDSFRDFSGRMDAFTPVREIILDQNGRNPSNISGHAALLKTIARETGVAGLLDRDIKSLSTGEISRILIARALLKRPWLLILDEPFEGLDGKSRQSLSNMINDLMQNRMRVILVTHRFEEIVPNITHVLFLKSGKVHTCGKKKRVLTPETINEVYGIGDTPSQRPQSDLAGAIARLENRRSHAGPNAKTPEEQKLIEMKHVRVKIGADMILDDFNWVMRRGENWAIFGPDGAGKTTVLKLILGENLQAYANEIYLFGRRKGSGESIWDIRRHLGYISSELQKKHPDDLKAFEIVCSGFFDTLGLYRQCEKEDIRIAREWIGLLGIESLSDTQFGFLSHGQKQLVLIARAMVKSPVLLILDEPCEGLDMANRSRIMKVLDLIGEHTKTSLLYVPSREEDIMACITHILRMDGGEVLERIQRDRNSEAARP